MKVNAIKDCISSFVQALNDKTYAIPLYLYEQREYSFKKEHAIQWVENSLQSDITQRMWKREDYRPKENMLSIASENPAFFGEAMQDLFQEDKELSGRIERFIFCMDELLRDYRRQIPHSTLSDHHIQAPFVSILLQRKYPKRYAFYRLDVLQYMTKRFHAPPVPHVDDLPRFLKMIQIINKFLVPHLDVLPLQRYQSIKEARLDSMYANLGLECILHNSEISLTES